MLIYNVSKEKAWIPPLLPPPPTCFPSLKIAKYHSNVINKPLICVCDLKSSRKCQNFLLGEHAQTRPPT